VAKSKKSKNVFGAIAGGNVEEFRAFCADPAVFGQLWEEKSVLSAAATDPELLRVALGAGADVNFGGIEPPIVAAARGFYKAQTVKLLIDAGADVNAIHFGNGDTALHILCGTIATHCFDEDVKAIDLVVAAGGKLQLLNDKGEAPFGLLEKNVEAFERVAEILKMTRVEDLKRLIERLRGRAGEVERVDRVAVTPKEYRQKAFVAAAWRGDEIAAQGFMEAGADIDALDEADGVNALYAACEKNHLGMVKLLLDKGANANAVSIPRRVGVTAIHIAVKSHLNVELVDALLKAGADAGHKSKMGDTIWEQAWRLVKTECGRSNSHYDDPRMFEFFLAKGLIPPEKFVSVVKGSDSVGVKKALGG
jgi:hypothetical protein